MPPTRVGIFEVVKLAEELQESSGHDAATLPIVDVLHQLRDRLGSNAVIGRDETAIHQQTEIVVPASLAIDEASDGLKRCVRDSRELRELGEQKQEILEALSEKCQTGLRAVLSQKSRYIRISNVIRFEKVLDIFLETFMADLIFAR